MKLNIFARKNTVQKKADVKPVSFRYLTKPQQDEALKIGAERFSRDFTKTFEKLARE